MTDLFQLKRCIQDLAGSVERINVALMNYGIRGFAETYEQTEADLADLRQALLEI